MLVKAAIELRRKIHQQFADMIRSLVDNGRGQLTGVRPLSRDMAMALVGGINELMMLAVEDGGGPRLREVADTALQLVWAVLWTLPEQNSLARQ
jgi:hypothetical protein